MEKDHVKSPSPDGFERNWFIRRVHGWTFQAYTICLGNAAVYLVLYQIKWHPRWLHYLEAVIFCFNILIWSINTFMIFLKLVIFPRQILGILNHPAQGLFVPIFVLAGGTLLVGAAQYGDTFLGPDFFFAMFWAYAAIGTISTGVMSLIWLSQGHGFESFTPITLFLIFPFMFSGTLCYNMLNHIPPTQKRSISVLMTGYFMQGLGTCVTFMWLAVYLMRVINKGFPKGHMASGQFVACGPPGYTALAVAELGRHLRQIFMVQGSPLYKPLIADAVYAGSIIISMFFVGFAVFFFFISACVWLHRFRENFDDVLGCWASTFPLVGFVTTLRVIGDVFDSKVLWILHVILASLISLDWLGLILFTAWAFFTRRIFISPTDAVLEDLRKGGSDSKNSKSESEVVKANGEAHEQGEARRRTGGDPERGQ